MEGSKKTLQLKPKQTCWAMCTNDLEIKLFQPTSLHQLTELFSVARCRVVKFYQDLILSNTISFTSSFIGYCLCITMNERLGKAQPVNGQEVICPCHILGCFCCSFFYRWRDIADIPTYLNGGGVSFRWSPITPTRGIICCLCPEQLEIWFPSRSSFYFRWFQTTGNLFQVNSKDWVEEFLSDCIRHCGFCWTDLGVLLKHLAPLKGMIYCRQTLGLYWVNADYEVSYGLGRRVCAQNVCVTGPYPTRQAFCRPLVTGAVHRWHSS